MMIRIFICFALAIQAILLQAQVAYWGIEFTLSDQKNYIGYSNYHDYEAAFRQGDDAQDNGFAGLPIHFDVDTRKFSYSDEGGLSTNRTLLQIHKISTNEVMSVFFQLEAKCEGICMINFPRIPFQAGTFEVAPTDIQYNPILVNPKNIWKLANATYSENEVVPKAITEIPYYPNPEIAPVPTAKTEPISLSQPLVHKNPATIGNSPHIELAAMKNKEGFFIKCTTPNRLEKPIATIFDFNTDYNQVIIEFKDIPNSGASASPLSKEIFIPNIPRKTYNLIVLYNNTRSVGKLLYTGTGVEISLEGSENIIITQPKVAN